MEITKERMIKWRIDDAADVWNTANLVMTVSLECPEFVSHWQCCQPALHSIVALRNSCFAKLASGCTLHMDSVTNLV